MTFQVGDKIVAKSPEYPFARARIIAIAEDENGPGAYRLYWIGEDGAQSAVLATVSRKVIDEFYIKAE